MNAASIHLASFDCWQRARSYAVKPSAFIVLQSLAAEDLTSEVHAHHLLRKTGLPIANLYKILNKLESQGLITFTTSPVRGKRGRHGSPIRLTSQGMDIMTPTPAPSNPWKHSQL